MSLNCVCLLTIKPSEIWLKFLSKFTNYKVIIVCDDNSVNYSEILDYPNLQFVQIPNSECLKFGFANLSSAISPKQIVNSWDKAMYYFSKINLTFNNVWLIEDDVYFYSEKTLLDIDIQYTNNDLLSNTITSKSDDMKSPWQWHWCLFSINLPEPHFRAMACAIRISKKLFSCIAAYADNNGTLFFLEPLFPTLAYHNTLIHTVIEELLHIEYRHEWLLEDIDTRSLYHPIKNLYQHIDNREIERF